MIRRILGLTVLALSLPLAACDDGQGVGSPGVLSLYLTDAAGDFTQAVVTIERIELVGGDEGARVLRDEPFTTDLLTLSNDVASLVEEETIPAGTYSQLRFVIHEACIGVEQADGSEAIYASDGFDDCGTRDGELQMPSFGQSGLKIGLPGGSIEVDGDTRILLLDFDVSQSFGQQAGGSGRWVMNPVIKADDISLSGSITVELTVADSVDLSTVGSSLADFEAELDTEPQAVAFADDDDDGVFTASFLFLMPDEDYEVSVSLKDGVSYTFTLNPTSPQSVSLGSAEQATVAFEVTSAAPNP
jgi:hypothetical protein